MDSQFTEKLGAWLKASPAERDYALGCKMYLQLTGRVIMYKNLLAVPDMARLEVELQQKYNFRVKELTREQVAAMSAQVEKIADAQNLEKVEDDRPKGKRPDHDSLPPEIQACYVENLSVLRRMREVHLRLRTLSLDNHPCPDSERYPFLKELIELDKKYRGNWRIYDSFTLADETHCEH